MSLVWANYGAEGYLGLFEAAEAPSFGSLVLARTPRGEEMASVLDAPLVTPSDPVAGEIMRAWTDADDEAARLSRGGAFVLVESAACPVEVIDIEAIDGGRTVIVHGFAVEEIDGWLAGLESALGASVRFLDLSALPQTADAQTAKRGCSTGGCGTGGGCSTGGCGTSGGGCSTGSCSRDTKRAEPELREYLLGLRAKMEAGGRVGLN